MTTLKTATLAAALVVGTTSLAMAQNAPGGANGNNGMPPEGYKGPGAYQGYKASDFQQQGTTGANAAAGGGAGMRATTQRGHGARIAAGHPAVGYGRMGYGYGRGYGYRGWGYGAGAVAGAALGYGAANYGYGYGQPSGYAGGYAGLYNSAPGYYGGGYQAAGYGQLPGVYYGEPPGLYDEFVGYQFH